MLVRPLYASRAVDRISPEEPLNIPSQSKANKPLIGITGVLCSRGLVFLPCLEGGRVEVNGLYNLIAADPRHGDVVILSYEESNERTFANWSMGLGNLEQVNASLLLRYSETATLDPYGASGTHSMALLHKLMARASSIGQSNPSPPAARQPAAIRQ